METRSIIQASASIVKVTHLKVGDVYKRVEESNYSGASMKYGIVMDLMNDGSNCFIEALEYEKSYGNITAKVVIMSGKKDVSLFPCGPEEVRMYLQESLNGMSKDIEEKKKEIAAKEEAYAKAQEFVSGEAAKKLTAITFDVLPDPVSEVSKF